MRLGAALVALVACAAPPAAPLHNAVPAVPDERCELPFDRTELSTRGEVHVLAWKRELIESALILVVAPGRFALAHKIHAADGWRDAPFAPGNAGAVFAGPPTRQQLDSFLVGSGWIFGPRPDHALSAKGICGNEWRRYFNSEPWHHFGEIAPLTSRRDPAP